MKAIIIGIPGNGKSTLAHYIQSLTGVSIPIVHVGSIRRNLSIHAPHRGYECEIAPSNISLLTSILDTTLKHFNNVIIEGYGLNPIEALKLAKDNNAKVVMLCHKLTDASIDVETVLEYDKKDKWTHRRPKDYLLNLWGFYKEVEKKWIKDLSDDIVIDTYDDFDLAIAKAASILLTDNPISVVSDDCQEYSMLNIYDNLHLEENSL